MEHNELPEYIKEYRDQSWQIEILIAGGVVFSLYSITDTFREYFFETWPLVNYGSIQILFLFFAYFITRILLFGFIANLFFRAVWLAYLGINFSFPKGIKYNNINASDFRKEVLRLRPNIVERVIFLEKLCNLTYSIAILLALFSTSILIIMVIIIWLLECLGFYGLTQDPYFTYILALVIAIINSGLLDSILFRKKSNSKLASTKEAITSVLDYLTLAFLFKREFMVIKSNTRKWLFYFFVFLITGVSLFVSVVQLGEYYPWGTIKLKPMDERSYYDLNRVPEVQSYSYDSNLSDKSIIFRGSIQSDIVKDKYLRLFVVSWHRFENYLEYTFKKEDFPLPSELNNGKPYNVQDNLNTDSLYNNVINSLFTVYIDSDSISDLQWLNYKHPLTREDGYLTYIPIDSLSFSKHVVKVDVSWRNKEERRRGRWFDIPFWKE